MGQEVVALAKVLLPNGNFLAPFPLMIEISPVAAEEISRIKLTKQKPESKLRLSIEEGGCSGLIYCLSLETKGSENSNQEEFEFESSGIEVVIDSKNYASLQGIKIDYAEDLMGGGFRFNNPNSQDSCSCGNSFALKESDLNK